MIIMCMCKFYDIAYILTINVYSACREIILMLQVSCNFADYADLIDNDAIRECETLRGWKNKKPRVSGLCVP